MASEQEMLEMLQCDLIATFRRMDEIYLNGEDAVPFCPLPGNRSFHDDFLREWKIQYLKMLYSKFKSERRRREIELRNAGSSTSNGSSTETQHKISKKQKKIKNIRETQHKISKPQKKIKNIRGSKKLHERFAREVQLFTKEPLTDWDFWLKSLSDSELLMEKINELYHKAYGKDAARFPFDWPNERSQLENLLKYFDSHLSKKYKWVHFIPIRRAKMRVVCIAEYMARKLKKIKINEKNLFSFASKQFKIPANNLYCSQTVIPAKFKEKMKKFDEEEYVDDISSHFCPKREEKQNYIHTFCRYPCENLRCKKKKVCIEERSTKGWGLFALENIKKGELIEDLRGRLSDDSDAKFDYSIQFDTFFIDCKKGNAGRFINHSCSPNASFERTWVHGIPVPLVMAIKDIQKFEEITCHYGGELSFECACGAATCVSNAAVLASEHATTISSVPYQAK